MMSEFKKRTKNILDNALHLQKKHPAIDLLTEDDYKKLKILASIEGISIIELASRQLKKFIERNAELLNEAELLKRRIK